MPDMDRGVVQAKVIGRAQKDKADIELASAIGIEVPGGTLLSRPLNSPRQLECLSALYSCTGAALTIRARKALLDLGTAWRGITLT
jgi:hypothetical protein